MPIKNINTLSLQSLIDKCVPILLPQQLQHQFTVFAKVLPICLSSALLWVLSLVFRLIEAGIVIFAQKSLGLLGLFEVVVSGRNLVCLLYTSPSPRDQRGSRMPSSA